MKSRRSFITAAFLLFALMTAARADDLRAAMEADNARWLAAYNTQNGAAFPAMYTKDAVVLPPGAQPVSGREAIGQFWASRIKGGNRKDHTFEIVSLQQDGKYASQVARWTLMVVKDTGEATHLSGNTVRIFERQDDGQWLTKVHIFNLHQ